MQTLSLEEIDAVSGAVDWGTVKTAAEVGGAIGTGLSAIPGGQVAGGVILVASGVAYIAAAVWG